MNHQPLTPIPAKYQGADILLAMESRRVYHGTVPVVRRPYSERDRKAWGKESASETIDTAT